jgi:hypothetical protein
MTKNSMDEDLAKYPLYSVGYRGQVIRCTWVKTVNDYNHFVMNVHHYIPKGEYKRNKQWYDERGIEQKLFYIPCWLHEQIHRQAVKNLTDEEFEQKFKISRWDLVFNKRYSKY